MKNHHHQHPIHPAPPTHEQIAVCAFLLWIDHGQPANTHEAIWLEAEKKLTTGKIS